MKASSTQERNWRGGRGWRSPMPFFENAKSALILQKSALILKNRALFVCIYGLNSHLNYSFKSILEKKHQNFSLLGPSFVWCT